MADDSINRMNLSAIKKIDPYAKGILDSSSHVAFYTFNSEQNEWEKTDVEGVFFIYKRNAAPFYSIFINNRLNTTSFVEPITGQLELQSQPPFLLYRNERSRIRGFWFYNSEECDRIGNLISSLVQNKVNSTNNIVENKPTSASILKMLSKAQQEYNNQNVEKLQENDTPCNVLQFFASAKQQNFGEAPLNQVLSVDQIEKQHRTQSPAECAERSIIEKSCLSPTFERASISLKSQSLSILTDSKSTATSSSQLIKNNEYCLKRLLVGEERAQQTPNKDIKPALMPPTMFDVPSLQDQKSLKPLNATQFVEAFNHLIQNDKDFVMKLHDAYLKTLSKSMFELSVSEINK